MFIFLWNHWHTLPLKLAFWQQSSLPYHTEATAFISLIAGPPLIAYPCLCAPLKLILPLLNANVSQLDSRSLSYLKPFCKAKVQIKNLVHELYFTGWKRSYCILEYYGLLQTSSSLSPISHYCEVKPFTVWIVRPEVSIFWFMWDLFVKEGFKLNWRLFSCGSTSLRLLPFCSGGLIWRSTFKHLFYCQLEWLRKGARNAEGPWRQTEKCKFSCREAKTEAGCTELQNKWRINYLNYLINKISAKITNVEPPGGAAGKLDWLKIRRMHQSHRNFTAISHSFWFLVLLMKRCVLAGIIAHSVTPQHKGPLCLAVAVLIILFFCSFQATLHEFSEQALRTLCHVLDGVTQDVNVPQVDINLGENCILLKSSWKKNIKRSQIRVACVKEHV